MKSVPGAPISVATTICDSLVVTKPTVCDTTLVAPDVFAMLIADKRSENTRRAYRQDVHQFFAAVYQAEPIPERVRQFLGLNTPQMAVVLLGYKASLIAEGKSEATINRRMAAVMSLIRFARRVGATQSDPSASVDAEKVIAYRDTKGIGINEARRLIRQPDRSTLKGKRDYALLLLLLENALRRAEICSLRLTDFEPEQRMISVLGKGRGTQKERVTLSAQCVSAIQNYLAAHVGSSNDQEAALFVNVSPASYGRGLTPDGLYKIIRELSAQAGVSDCLSPHRLRHTAITLALDASGGDIRRVQRLSRHARMETLQRYDDNRNDLQGEVTALLSGLLMEPELAQA